MPSIPNMPSTSTAASLRRQTPAQDQLSQKIALEQKKLSIMRQQFDSGFGNVTKKDITTAEGEITKLEKMLSRKISLTNASQKLRTKRRIKCALS
jgi:polyhydroxyalkanoate synthesis regulator phasin